MDLKRRALGRGLGALIPVADNGSTQQNEVLLTEISPSPYQPREVFADPAIDDLANSVRRNGILQPLVVRRVPGGYELIAGERRFRAARRVGLERVPVIVRDASDEESLELALIENIQREDLNPLEEARAYRRLMDEFRLTQEQVAEKVAKDRSTVANTVRLLQLPEAVQHQVASGQISAGHARSLITLGSATTQVAVAREVVAQRLNVRATEQLVRKHREAHGDADVRAAETQLGRALGTKVTIQMRRGGKGKIELQFYSLAELNGLIDRLGGERRAATNF